MENSYGQLSGGKSIAINILANFRRLKRQRYFSEEAAEFFQYANAFCVSYMKGIHYILICPCKYYYILE